MKYIIISFIITPFLSVLLYNGPVSAGSNCEKGNDRGKGKPSFYKTDVVADGNSSEWESSLFYYDHGAQTTYAFVNDSNALYVCLKILSEDQQMKILHSGLEIWIDLSGKKNKISGILCFFEAPLMEKKKSMINPGETGNQKRNRVTSAPRIKEIILKGLKDESSGNLQAGDDHPAIKIAFGFDSTGILICEAKIPFAVFTSDIKKSRAISLGCVFPEMDLPQMERGERPDGGMGEEGYPGMGEPGGGKPRGGMPGGGMPGGPGGEMGGGGKPGQDQAQNMSKENTFWYKTTLAKTKIK